MTLEMLWCQLSNSQFEQSITIFFSLESITYSSLDTQAVQQHKPELTPPL